MHKEYLLACLGYKLVHDCGIALTTQQLFRVVLYKVADKSDMENWTRPPRVHAVCLNVLVLLRAWVFRIRLKRWSFRSVSTRS